MDHIKMLQVLFEVAVKFFVGVPQEGKWRFADVFKTLMEVRDDVVVLHILLHRFDDEVDENVGI